MFDFKELCFICAKKLDRKHKKVITVPNDNKTKQRIIELCETNDNEDSLHVIDRIKSIPSLFAAKAAYHEQCYDKLVQVSYSTEPKKDPKYEAALQKVFNHITESGKQEFTLKEFRDLLQDQFRNNQMLYAALKRQFGDEITIITAKTKLPKFLYKKADIAQICMDWHNDKDSVSDAAKKTVLKVSAKILRTEVENCTYNYPSYPESSTFLEDLHNDIPPQLSSFVDNLLSYENDSDDKKNRVKRNFIAHSIISALRPKSFLSTLQLALGTYIYKRTGSKWIIKLLSKLGVSASYEEIEVYEASTTMNPVMFDITNAFLQYVANNSGYDQNTSDDEEMLLEMPSSKPVEQKRTRSRSRSCQNKRKKC